MDNQIKIQKMINDLKRDYQNDPKSFILQLKRLERIFKSISNKEISKINDSVKKGVL